MISADSPDEMKSPLLDDGSLDYDNQMAWPSPAMLELPEELLLHVACQQLTHDLQVSK